MGDRIFHLFKNYGVTDNSTFLVWDQFLKVMSIIHKGSIDEKTDMIYFLFDLDMDTYISKIEMARIFGDFMDVIKKQNVEDENFVVYKECISEVGNKEMELVVLELVNEVFAKYAKKEKSKISV